MKTISNYIVEKYKLNKQLSLNNAKFGERDSIVTIKINCGLFSYTSISLYDISVFLKFKDGRIYYEKNEPWEKEDYPYILNSNNIFEYKTKVRDCSYLFLTIQEGIDFIQDIIIDRNFENLKNWLDKNEKYTIDYNSILIEKKEDFKKVLRYLKNDY